MAAAAATSRLPVRALLALIAVLALLVSAPTARAQSYEDPWGDEGVPEATWVEEGWEEDEELFDDEDVLPAEDLDPSLVLPAKPWTPPSSPSPSPAPARPAVPTVPVPKGRMIKGRRALVRADGRAAI